MDFDRKWIKINAGVNGFWPEMNLFWYEMDWFCPIWIMNDRIWIKIERIWIKTDHIWIKIEMSTDWLKTSWNVQEISNNWMEKD